MGCSTYKHKATAKTHKSVLSRHHKVALSTSHQCRVKRDGPRLVPFALLCTAYTFYMERAIIYLHVQNRNHKPVFSFPLLNPFFSLRFSSNKPSSIQLSCQSFSSIFIPKRLFTHSFFDFFAQLTLSLQNLDQMTFLQ